jgi:hypothetical protein
MKSPAGHRVRQLILMGGAGMALFGVFMLYAQPDFLVTLSNQVWACF